MQYRKIFVTAFFVLFVLLAGNAAQAQITTGTVAPDLTLPDQNNVNQSLSSLRGNWVLVYFWASWDGASRAGTPKLASLYGKYQNAGFTSARGFRVYTVSLDSDKKEWTNALKVDAIPGPYNVNDFYSASAATYQVQKVPSAYLVDANGVIRAVNPSFTDVESILNADTGQGGTVAMQTFNTGAAVNTAAKMESVRGSALQTTSTTSYYNQTTTTTTTPAALPEGNTYKIQIGAYKKLNLGDFYGVSHYGNVVSESADNDIKRVMVGNFDSKQAAVDALYRIQKEGYPDAFLVEYKNAQRVRVVGKSEIQAPAAAAPVSAVSNGNTIAVPLASPQPQPQPAADLVYRSVEPIAQPVTNTPAFNATAKNTGSSGSTVVYTAPPSYSMPSSQVTVYTNAQPQSTQGTIYDQPGFIPGSDKTYIKNASVNTPSSTGTMPAYTPGDTRFTNTTATTTQPAKTTTTSRPTTTTQPPATTGSQMPVPPKQPGTTTATQPPPQPGTTAQTQQPSPVVSPTSENSLDKQIDNYLGVYDYTLIENSKSKRLKNKSKREKKKDKKKR